MASIKKHRDGRKRTGKRRKKKLKVIAMLAAAGLVAVFGGVYLALSHYVGKTDKDVICDNVFIGTMDVSGMTEREAAEALQAQLTTDEGRMAVLKLREHNIEASLKELGFDSPDMKKLAKKAVDYGKKDSVWKRYRQMKKLEDEAYVLKENYTVDEKAVKALLEEKAVPLLQGPEDAYITRNEDGTLNIVDEKEGETIDEDGMVQNISDYLNEEWKHEAFSLELAVIKEKPEIVRADLEQVTDELGS